MRDETTNSTTGNTESRTQTPFVLLGLVVMSSLLLVPLGLNDPLGPFEALHVPTFVTQVLFISVVAVQPEARRSFLTIPKGQLLWLAALFCYVLALSVSSSIDFALLLGTLWLVHIVFLIAVVVFYRARALHVEDSIWMILGFAGLLHVGAFLVAWAFWPDNVRVHELPAFENIRHLGYFLAPVCAATATLFLTRKKNLLAPLLCFVAAAFYIIYTGSRGGAVATVAGLLVLGIYALWHGRPVSFIRIGALISAIVALTVLCEYLPLLPWPPLFSRTLAVIDQTGVEMLTSRDELWAIAWSVFKDNWLFGAGPSWLVHMVENPQFGTKNPHNIVLQLLSNWGVIGTTLIVGAVLSFHQNLVRALVMKPDQTMVPAAVLTTMLIHSLVAGGLYNAYSIVVAIIAFASLVQIGWQAPSSMSEPSGPRT